MTGLHITVGQKNADLIGNLDAEIKDTRQVVSV